MNITALTAAFFVGMAVFLILSGVKKLKASKTVAVDKFKAFATMTHDEKRGQYEEILSRSKVPVKTALTLIVAGGIMMGIAAYVVTGTLWITFVATAGGISVPNMWYNWHTESNKKVMLKQMEQACEIMATILRTGSSLPEALERAAREVKDPLRAELVKTATQIRVGVPSSVAFMEFVQRTEIPELKIVSMAIDFQETGMAVNVPSLFLQLQADIRHKIQFAKEVSSTTTENKMSGIIVATVPFVTLTTMRLFAPEFVAPLLTTPLGLAIFVTCCIAIFGGIKWMFNIADLTADM